MKSKGFTLIELLVVITLIGVLAVAVLSALNPIEQINKAKDAGKRADASQLLSALDRYFASNLKFPWNNFTGTNGCGGVACSSSVDVEFAGTAEMIGVGVCGNSGVTNDATATNSNSGGCVAGGYLSSTEELKEQFGKRSYFKLNVVAGDKLYIYKAADDPSASVCFVPGSRATRDLADDPNTPLKNLGIDGNGNPTQVIACSGTPTSWATLTGANPACFVCIPEE